LSIEADEDTGNEAGDGDAGTGPDAGSAAKPRCSTRSAVGNQSAAVSAVKAAEKKKMRKRKATSPLAVVMPTIPTPRLREVESKVEEEEEKKDEAIEESCCQEAVGVGGEDVRGCPLAEFGGAADCYYHAGKDACDD
jgi:hypothetical protein